MKKFLATALCVTIAMSLMACSKKEPSQGGTVQPSEATVEVDKKTGSDPSATVTTVYNPASEFVKDKVEKFTIKGEVDEDGEKEEDEELVYHLPELQIKSSYAESVNKEINTAFEKIKKDLKKEDDAEIFGTSYIAYLTKEGILSLVFIMYEEYDMNEYKVYNIDTKTGEKVDNARIAQIAGVSGIRKAGMDALQAFYNKMEWYTVKDYKAQPEKGEKTNPEAKDIEKCFSEKYLNDKMRIGLTSEGKMFFVSNVYTGGGAGDYDFVYDVNGNNLDDEDNQCWVGERYPDDEDDEDEEDDDSLPDDDEDINFEEDED